MVKLPTLFGLCCLATLSACTDVALPLQTVSTSAEAAAGRFSDWEGKWIGPEGMYVDITELSDGRYSLAMQSDLDTFGTYTGRDSDRGIEFDRNGETLTLFRASGDDTGMKWLAGKADCLKVRDGEGYCRD
jgi:hypothetical protein